MITILMSIQAEHNANIEKGLKLGELRTRIPKVKPPFKVLTYESGKNGRHKVTNEWICREIEHLTDSDFLREVFEGKAPTRIEEITCVDLDYILQYKGEKKYIYNMLISDLVIYDEPRELSKFKRVCDGNCQLCKYSIWERRGWTFEPRIVDCEPITRPPQSWQYIESEVVE